ELNKELQSDEVVNDYQKYNEITEQLNTLEEELLVLMDTWEALQM
ncbi:MAG: hypothetical protein ACK5LC_08190, partial [Coprobacillaceae bacterium]